MKTSLLAAAVLMAIASSAHAETPPAYAPIQITSPGGNLIAALQVTPAQAVVQKPVAVQKAVVTPKKESDSVAELNNAEANFKSSKANQPKPVVQKGAAQKPGAVQPAAVQVRPAAQTQVEVQPVVKAQPKIQAQAQVKAIPATAQKPVVRAQAQGAAPLRQITPVYMSRRQMESTALSGRTNAQVKMTAGMDAASLLSARCATLGKKALKCMNLELARAEDQVDSLEVKLLNCREIRKFDHIADNQMIDGFVDSHMYKMRMNATQAFNAEMAEAGEVNKRKTLEIELRATLKHENAVGSFASKVCSKPAFVTMFEKAASAQ